MNYDELDTVQIRNAEVLVSSLTRKGSRDSKILAIAPRKTFMNGSSNVPSLYIPKNSSLEFEDLAQVEDLIGSLVDACRSVFGAEPRNIITTRGHAGNESLV